MSGSFSWQKLELFYFFLIEIQFGLNAKMIFFSFSSESLFNFITRSNLRKKRKTFFFNLKSKECTVTLPVVACIIFNWENSSCFSSICCIGFVTKKWKVLWKKVLKNESLYNQKIFRLKNLVFINLRMTKKLSWVKVNMKLSVEAFKFVKEKIFNFQKKMYWRLWMNQESLYLHLNRLLKKSPK